MSDSSMSRAVKLRQFGGKGSAQFWKFFAHVRGLGTTIFYVSQPESVGWEWPTSLNKWWAMPTLQSQHDPTRPQQAMPSLAKSVAAAVVGLSVSRLFVVADCGIRVNVAGVILAAG